MWLIAIYTAKHTKYGRGSYIYRCALIRVTYEYTKYIVSPHIDNTNQGGIGNEHGIRSICGKIVMRSLQHLLSQHFYWAGISKAHKK